MKQQKHQRDPRYINNTFLEENQDDFQELIYQLKNNELFQKTLIPIWKLFPVNYQGEISKLELRKYLTRVFQFLVYVLRKGDMEILAEEECQRLLNIDQETISLNVFNEIFAYFTCKWLENNNLNSAIAFLNLVLSRTTRLVVKDTLNKQEDQVIQHDIIVQLYNKEPIEEPFNVVQKDLVYQNNIHYEEIVKLDEKAVQIAENDHNKTLIREILDFNQIIPLGYSCESYIDILKNNGFTLEKECKYQHQQASSKFIGLEKVQIIPQFDDKVIDDLKQYIEDDSIVKITSVLHKHIENQKENQIKFNRLNTLIQREIYFKHIKLKEKDEERYINILSEFLEQKDFNIDQIDQLHRKRQEKLTRKKQQENNEEFQLSIKKQQIDYENTKKELNFQLIKNIQTFQIKEQQTQAIKQLKDQIQQDSIQQSLDLKQFTSKYSYLPKDSLKHYNEDIIEYANQVPLQILIIGKPKTGKTTFCQEFAKQVNIVHIEPLLLIEKALNRIKDFEENPPEMDEDGNPTQTLPPCDQKVKEQLENGQEIQPEVLLDLVNNELKHHLAINKGFILDLPLCNRAYEFSWIDAIVRNKVMLPKIGCRYFSHIIEFENSDAEVIEFMEKHMENQETGKLYSQFDRDILRKPKKKAGDGEEEEEEEPPADDDDEEGKKIQEEKDLTYLPNNRGEIIREQLQIFNRKTKKQINEFHSHLPINKHLKISPSGLNAQELVEIAQKKLGDEVEILRPLAVKLEGGSEKDQLTIEGQKIYRQWSPWYQIDCVEVFHKGRVIQGRGDLACDYAGRVFLFDSEENQQKFFENPRKYLNKPPQLPNTYNIAIVGPRLSGKKTYARKLAKQYNLQLIDIEQIICEKLVQQKQIESEQGHQPSNFEQRANDVHLSEQEWKEFYKGKEVNTKDIWSIILHKLGKKLQKKPEGWGVEKKDDEEEDEQKLEEEKKKNAKKQVKKQQKDNKKDGDDERPKTPPVEDLPLNQIIQQIQEDGKTIPPVQGLIIVGQPMNEEQINVLKYHNIPIDKIVCLLDSSEEEPGKILNSRPGFEETYNLESELASIQTAQGLLKETYGEENVKDIHIGGTEDEVFNRIRTNIDPFFIRPDDEAFIRVQGDVNQEEEDNIVFGEYGPFCPVTLKDDNWLIPGKFENPEKGESIEAYVQGRRHLFFGETEQQKFKENVSAYFQEGQRVQVPPPRIMLLGVRGAGVHTQLNLLQQQYKIPILDFKENLQAQLLNERQKRSNTRLCNEIGFQPPPADEDEGAVQIENKDPEDFDYKAHELDLTKRIFNNVQQLFINGNFYKPVPPEDETQVDPNDQNMVPITAELHELLNETKKLPEVIMYLQVSDENFMKRTYDTIEQSLIDKYDKEINDKRDEKERKRREIEEIRAKQIEEGVEEDQLEPFEEEEEEDPNAYQEGLQAILTAKKEELMAQKTADQEALDALTGEFDNMGIPIVPIQCNRSIDKVFDQISYKLKIYLEQRQNMLEKYQSFEIKRPQQEEDDEGNLPVDPLVHYEKSYNYKKSRYYDRNPITLIDVPKIKEYPLIYRNRIYYFSSKEQLQQIKQQPLKYLTKETFPNDVKNRPQIFVIGKPKTGKSTLTKLLEEKLQLVRIKPSNILEDFIEEHSYLLSQQAKDCQRNGKEVPDEVLVDLILKRTQMADCIQQGWVLDGFPKSRKQAEIFSERGLIPSNVFCLKLDNYKIVQRCRNLKKSNKFGYNDIILHSQLKKEQNHINELENYYILKYNNIRFLDSLLSKWGIYDYAKKAIYSSLSQRQQFARSLITDTPVQINNLCLTQEQILHNLGSFENYSPVALKTSRQFINNNLNSSNLVYFDRFLYILNSQQETQDFLKRPDLYLYQKLKKMEVPRNINLGNIVGSQEDIQCKSYCMGNLLNNKLEKSMLDILCSYRGNVYSFSSFKQRCNFNQNPQKYMNVKLPDKLPVTFNKKNLVKKVAKKGDCTAYLEHHLGDKVMRVLAQLGYKRLKYPTINCKETALKFIAISLKALNPNKDVVYRQKYNQKLQLFLKNCNYAETIQNENKRKNMAWKQQDEKEFNAITEQSERQQLLDNIHSADPWNDNDEEKYISIQEQYQSLQETKGKGKWTEEQEQELKNCLFEYKVYLAQKKYRSSTWQQWDEENLLKITEEFAEFMDNLQNEDKDIFFRKFIR